MLIYCNPPFVALDAFRAECVTALRETNALFPGKVSLAFLVPCGGRVSSSAVQALTDWRDVFPRFIFPSQNFPVRSRIVMLITIAD